MKHGHEVHDQLPMADVVPNPTTGQESASHHELTIRVRQQAAIAYLGQLALSGTDPRALMDEAAAALAETLEVGNTEVLELLPSGDAFLLRAGIGWNPGRVGHSTVNTGTVSHAGYTLVSQEPVVIEDLREEARFSSPPILIEHGIVSGMSVAIQGGERPFGVLGVHTSQKRHFTVDDIHFLQAVANVLASAIERKRIEEELRASGDQLKTILQGVADGVTAQDRSGRVVFANDAAARMAGYPSAEEMTRATPEELLSRFEIRDDNGFPVTPDQLPGRRALRGEASPEMVLRFRVLDTSEERWSVVKAQPVVDEWGRPEMAINIFRDFTDRKRSEDAQRFLADATGLLASSLDYETTLARVARLAVPHVADWCVVHLVAEDGSLQPLAVAHVDPSKTEAAREFQKRYPPDLEAPRGLGNVLHTGQPEIYPEVPDLLLVAAARSEEHLRAIREIGVRSLMIVPMVARGRVLGVISLVSAESGRRFGQEDLALAQHLARRSALAVDNARLYREAQEAIRLRNELFSSVSHDLKNPLTGIKGMAQLLRRQLSVLGQPDRERLLEGLESIIANASRMTSQIDELLDVARLQMGETPALNVRATDLVRLVREVAEEQQRTTRRHHLKASSPLERIVGEWDTIRLSRVIANLVSNAIKYSPHGGDIEIEVTREEDADRVWAVMSVTDHGMGIPAADLGKVFEGFQRAANVEGRIAGTGLGLASARQIVELHGGTIEVTSEEGKGSTFTVRLPLHLSERSSEAA